MSTSAFDACLPNPFPATSSAPVPSSYAARWLRVWSTTSGVGVGLACWLWSPDAALGCLLAMTAFGVVAQLSLGSPDTPVQDLAAAGGWALACRRAFLGAASVVALLALAAASPALAGLLLLVAGPTCPPCVEALRRLLEGGTPYPAPHRLPVAAERQLDV